MNGWIDAHNHLQDTRLGDPDAIILTMREAGIVKCIVNATREDDWADIESLAAAHPDFIIPAFGIHPWHAHTASHGWQERLTALLIKHPQSSVGECGLDRWIDAPSIEVQKPVFIDQLRIARELNRCATIHCLRAWEAFFEAFKHQAPPQKFLLHSFNGSIETARRLIPLGARFSFSGYFLKPEKSRTLDIFRMLPLERILLETDAPDMSPPDALKSHPIAENLNHPANLCSIAHALADSLGMSPSQLAEITRTNTRDCFAIP
jgi:TatD DNase family protein